MLEMYKNKQTNKAQCSGQREIFRFRFCFHLIVFVSFRFVSFAPSFSFSFLSSQFFSFRSYALSTSYIILMNFDVVWLLLYIYITNRGFHIEFYIKNLVCVCFQNFGVFFPSVVGCFLVNA